MSDIDFQQLLADYWDAAYAEGTEGRAHDTDEGVAQQTLNAINVYVESLRQRVDAFESLETKRMKAAVTADDWKRIAEAMEYNYRCCSEGFNKTCGELRQRVKELEKDAARWKYTQQDRYFVTGPYDTDGNFQGYSVGVEPLIPDDIHWKERAKYGGLNQWIKGHGDTLETALDEAIAKDVK